MKAYIHPDTTTTRTSHGIETGWFADVVSSQDYWERGPWSRSYRTTVHGKRSEAELEARLWAKDNGYTIVTPENI